MIDPAQHPNPEQLALTRTRLFAVAVVLPVLIALAASLVILVSMPDLPAEIAVHWGANGADRFGSPWEIIATLLGVVGVLSGVLAFSLNDFAESGRPRPMQKALAVMALGLSVTLGTGMTASVLSQRSLDDVRTAPDPLPALLFGLLLGLIAAAVAWLLLPRADRTPPAAVDVEPLGLAPSERTFWTGTVSVSRIVLVAILGVIAILIGITVGAAQSGAQSVLFIVLLMALLLAVALTTLRWRVSVGQHGASVTAFAGWPAVRIPLADIDATRLISVNPVGDFGGWGWRWAGGRTGIILQAGPALEITRRTGRVLVVPIDDAETAVAVLQATLEQRDGA